MSDKLNICLMNDSFPPVIDGVANAVVNYARTISGGLGSATVVTPDYPDVQDDYPFDVVRYKSINTEKIWKYRAGYPFSSSKLSVLQETGFDIIHTHCPFASGIMARMLREKTGAPIIFTYHTKFDIEIACALPNKLLQEQATKFVVGNIAACDEVWVVSNGAGENLRSLGFEGKYHVMENGVDFPRGRADKQSACALRAAYDVPQDMPLFMFVGRLFWYKGIRLILDALKIIREKGVPFRMMFVGDGGDRAEIEKYTEELGLSDVCIFAGAVFDREDLRVFYTAGDMFLFPSEYDTNGIVVREAAACGVPALLIEGSCAAEGITHGRTGILTKPDAAAIAAELEFAAAHLDELHQIGENAMNEVYISWEDAVKRAYDRYFVVLEKVKGGQSDRTEGIIQEEFFSAMDSITASIQRFRRIPADIKTTTAKYKRILNMIKEELKKDE